MKRIINIALIIILIAQTFASQAQAESKIDLAIPVRFLEEIDTRSIEKGNAIPLEITQDIYVDGKILFKQGGAGYAEVAEIKHAGFFGRAGKISINSGKLTDIKGVSHNISLSSNASGDHRLSAIGGSLATAGIAYELAEAAILGQEATGIIFALGFAFLPIAFLFRRGNEAKLSNGKIMFARLT